MLTCGPCPNAKPICSVNTCETCAARCADTNCRVCIIGIDGITRCSESTGLNCTVCTDTDDCPDAINAVCYTATVDKSTGKVSTASENCANSGQKAACAYPTACQTT